MPYFFDPTFLLLVPPLLLAMYASSKVRSAFQKYSRYAASSGATGAEVARAILRRSGIDDVDVRPIEGRLSDHYNPRDRTLNLSRGVYQSNSLAALGVAAHEVGHAVQDARNYAPLKIRQGLYPVAAFGDNLGIILFFIGFTLLLFTQWTGFLLIAKLGVVLFALGAFFTIVTLPVEFNASRRALAMLQDYGFVSRAESEDARQVLNAAALTYVASAFMAVMMLVRFILLLSMAGGRD